MIDFFVLKTYKTWLVANKLFRRDSNWYQGQFTYQAPSRCTTCNNAPLGQSTMALSCSVALLWSCLRPVHDVTAEVVVQLQVMMSDWLKYWQSFKTMRAREQIYRILVRMLFLPVLAIIHIVAPRTELAKSWSAPMTKFVSHMAGYFIFIAVLFLHNYLDLKTGNRGPPNTGVVQLYIVLFVIGKCLTSLKNMWSYGYQVYSQTHSELYPSTFTLYVYMYVITLC